MSSRTAGVLLILLCTILSLLDNNNTLFIISIFIGGGAILPTRKERKQIHVLFELLKKNHWMPFNLFRVHIAKEKARCKKAGAKRGESSLRRMA